MKEKYEKYLPIGTVVLLENAKKKLMIIGFEGIVESGKRYDYIGCLYPEGIISSTKNLMFNHEQIKEIYYIGYNCEEWKTIQLKLKELVGKMDSGEITFPKTETINNEVSREETTDNFNDEIE